MSQYLHRGDAPWGNEIWEMIDKTVIEAAKTQLSARRILKITGPYGLGVKALPEKEEEVGSFRLSRSLPLAKIFKTFSIPVTDIAAYEANRSPVDLNNIAKTAIECAKMEDELIFYGSKELGAEGLLTAKGIHNVKLGEWGEVGDAVADIIKAVTALDNAGFHGPYTLALAPKNYNLLFRKYQQGQMTELEHVNKIVSKLVKAPGVKEGGVIVNDGPQYVNIALGQDLMTGFVGPVGPEYELQISETLALRLLQPKAVCVLK